MASNWTAEEARNAEVVRDFTESMGKRSAADRYSAHFAKDALARWESPPWSPVQWPKDKFIQGVDTLISGSKRYEDAKVNYVTEIHDIWAGGPMVVAKRTDTRIMDDGSKRPCPAIGMFLLRDGKIVEWQDFLGEVDYPEPS